MKFLEKINKIRREIFGLEPLYSEGGVIRGADKTQEIPKLISPGRFTMKKEGETWRETQDRLDRNEDCCEFDNLDDFQKFQKFCREHEKSDLHKN